MYYITHYEYAAIILLLFLMIEKRKYRKSNNESERRFYVVVGLNLVTCVVNIFAAYCFSNVIKSSDQMMLSVETIYLLLASITVLSELIMVCVRLQYYSIRFRAINSGILAVFSFLLIINVATGFMFEYQNHVFIGHLLFNAIYIMYGLFYLEMIILIMLFGNRFRKKVIIITSAMFFMPLTSILIQYALPDHIITGFGNAIALVMLGFTIGEGDYFKLQETKELLLDAREQELSIRERKETTLDVKNKLMKSVSSDLKHSVYDIEIISNEMKKYNFEEPFSKYIDEINLATNELMEYTDKLLDKANSGKY